MSYSCVKSNLQICLKFRTLRQADNPGSPGWVQPNHVTLGLYEGRRKAEVAEGEVHDGPHLILLALKVALGSRSPWKAEAHRRLGIAVEWQPENGNSSL